MKDNILINRIRHFSGMMETVYKISSWCFGKDKQLYKSSSPYEKEFLVFLESSGCLEYAIEEGGKTKGAFILSDPVGLMWIGEYVDLLDNELLILLGPIFRTNVSKDYIEESLQEMNLSIMVKREYMSILEKVPILNLVMINQCASMLYYAINEERLKEPVIYHKDKETHENSFSVDDLAQIDYEKAHQQEETLLQHVREGNINFEQEEKEEEVNFFAKPDEYQTGNPMRENKNTAIIFTSLCARAAAEGGLSRKIAKELEISYIKKIEDTKTISELSHVNWGMLKDYIKRVNRCKKNPNVSKPIQECCEYIKANFMKPLSLKNIAEETGYSEYYLTRKFHKEMGVRLLDYIKDIRIEHGKILLRTSSKTIEEICEELNFGTRNYFSRVFQRKTGLTPSKYRENIGG